MIELFDAARLTPRRDYSLVVAALMMAVGAASMSVYAASLQARLRGLEAHRIQLDGHLRQQAARPVPSATLVADLQLQVERLEGEVAAATGGPASYGLTAPQWLDRLGALAAADVSLSKIEIDRAGSARIEGLAASAQAVSGFVQAFSDQDKRAPVRARSIEVRQDKTETARLSFQMRATAPALAPSLATPPKP